MPEAVQTVHLAPMDNICLDVLGVTQEPATLVARRVAQGVLSSDAVEPIQEPVLCAGLDHWHVIRDTIDQDALPP